MEINHFEIPVTDSPLTDADLTVISAEINPLRHSDLHGIDIYQATHAFVILHSQRDD
jgi:hypothetical protein